MTQPKLPLEIDVLSVKQLLDSGEPLLLLDVREPHEHAAAKIDAATLIPMGQIPSRLAEIEAYKTGRVVVHCHHGGRSQRVMNYLRQQGFKSVQNMIGGIDEWSLQVDPSVPRYE